MADALMKAKNGQLDPASIVLEPVRPPVNNPPQRVREVSPRNSQTPSRRAGSTTRRPPVRKRPRKKAAQLAKILSSYIKA